MSPAVPPQVVACLEERDAMPLDGGNARRLHPRDAAAHDHDVLGRVGACDPEAYLLHRGGVHGAAELGVAVPDAADAVLVAAQAGPHVLGMALLQLDGQVGVGDESATKVREVDRAALDELGRVVRVEGACREEGNVHGLARGVADVAHAALSQVAGREDVVERLVAACVHVEGVHALALQDLEQGDGVLDGAATGEAVVERDAEDDGQGIAHRVLDCVDDLDREAGEALRGAAVLVGTVIPDRAHELVDEVACVGVHLDCVVARVTCDACRKAEAIHDAGDLVLGEGVALDVRVEDGGCVGRGDRRVAKGVRKRVATRARAYLAYDLGAIAMDPVADGCE